MRLAILGNSHAACLMTAVRDVPGVTGHIEPVFFASVAQNMGALRLNRDGVFVPRDETLKQQITRSSGGVGKIDPAAYDAFLVIGMNYEITLTSRAFSSAVRQAALKQSLQDVLHWDIVRRLREVTDRPIFCGHQPLRAIEDNRPQGDFLGYDETLAEIARETEPLSVTLVAQPEETRVDDLYTKAVFTQGSTKLGNGKLHDEGDRIHMNTDYGAIYLRHLADQLATP